jgi:ribonuclease BN (tRNA processing enzyme)
VRKMLIAVGLAAALVPLGAGAETRLILLGTAGGPTPKRSRAAPAQALVIDGSIFVVDCGNGVGRQMALAGLRLENLRHVFITHHHSDHVADLTTLPLLAWAADLVHPLTLHGPPPLRRSVRAGLRAAAFDVRIRESDEGRPSLGDLVRVHEFREDSVVFRDERVTVRAARVEHPPIREAYAYRFDTADRSIVISGDTAPSANLVRLARGADVLVHEVLLRSPDETADWLGLPADHPLVRHVVNSHTAYTDVGRVALDAAVGTLVLSHFVPGDETVNEEAVLTAIRVFYDGPVIFGRDLLEIP